MTYFDKKWRFNPSVNRAKGDRLVRARVLPVCDNVLVVFYSVAVVRRNVNQQFLEEGHITSVLLVCIDYYI